MKVGVKYCGDCNPRYDRVAEVYKLKEEFPDAAFVNASGNPDCDIVLVVCGCPAACADITGLQAKDEMFIIWQLADMERAREKLKTLCPNWRERRSEIGSESIGITKTEEAIAAEAAQAESLARADKAEAEEASRWFKMVMPLSGK